MQTKHYSDAWSEENLATKNIVLLKEEFQNKSIESAKQNFIRFT
jgi:hypothetical protein